MVIGNLYGIYFGVAGKRLQNVLCAPDSFKESLTAARAAEAMAAGVLQADRGLGCDRCPVADGGEGTLEILTGALGGRLHRRLVSGPLGEPVEASFGISADGATGIVELAEASGLALVAPGRRDPAHATTRGTGELIAAAAARGCSTVIVCLGGSATVDGGAAIAQALGGRFFDSGGGEIDEPMTGSLLMAVARYEPPAAAPRIRAAFDVTNPLFGPDGAAAVYGPQKGATPGQVRALDKALRHLASVCGGGADARAPGAGAAGGAGFGLAALLGATLHCGIDLVLEAVEFERRCAETDLVLTGEGCLDDQSIDGKAAVGVARAASALGVPTIAVVGQDRHGTDPRFDTLFARIESLSDRYGIERAMTEPEACLTETAAQLLREI